MTSKQPDILQSFHPLIADWFQQNYHYPSEAQILAWPVIQSGQHLLLTAPTGSGKTLSAFLGYLDFWARGLLPLDQCSIVYISPLKALNNDIQRNLIQPLESIQSHFQKHGKPFPDIQVKTRSGDTPQSERQRMLRRPPEILITTPESLNLIISTQNGANMLSNVRAVILDEIHAVAANKRGVHLMCAVERLSLYSGEFQRIALSATARPLSELAAFCGGQQLLRPHTQQIASSKQPSAKDTISAAYQKRVIVIREASQKRIPQLKIEYLARSVQDDSQAIKSPDFWQGVATKLLKTIKKHKSTLIFCNSRALTEKLALELNRNPDSPPVLCHHGSLSKELRLEAESRLKSGQLAAIVATSSLELGIDIGSVDKVILIQTPYTVSSAIQRIGRSGHNLHSRIKADFYATHPRDLLNASIMHNMVLSSDIEVLQPIKGALDVLSQVILSMLVLQLPEFCPLDQIFDQVRTVYAFADISRQEFDLVIQMLAGHYENLRIPELKARIHLDSENGRARARDGSRFLLYMSGGTIPQRGYYQLRVDHDNSRIGELDEEFVWERRLGDVMLFGKRLWRILEIDSNDVRVELFEKAPEIVFPFWRADNRNTQWHFASQLLDFLRQADEQLAALKSDIQNHSNPVLDWFGEKYLLNPVCSQALRNWLIKQTQISGVALPHRWHISFESQIYMQKKLEVVPVVLLNFWGGRINQALSLILKAAWQRTYQDRITIGHHNDGLLLMLPSDFDPPRILDLFAISEIKELLQMELENSGFFGAVFRDNAGRSLLLPGRGFNQRQPFWMLRERSKKLFERVRKLADFPVVLESWRTCLHYEFELSELAERLSEIQQGQIRISATKVSQATPLSQEILYQFTNILMYADDTPEVQNPSRLDHELLDNLFTGGEAIRFEAAEIRELELRLKRTLPAYAPLSFHEIELWLQERVALDYEEWQELWQSIQIEMSTDEKEQLRQEIQNHETTQNAKNSNHSFLILQIERPVKRRLLMHRDTARRYLLSLQQLVDLHCTLYQAKLLQLFTFDALPATTQSDDLIKPGGAARNPDFETHDLCALELVENDLSKPTRNEAQDLVIHFIERYLQFFGPIALDGLTANLGSKLYLPDLLLEPLLKKAELIQGAFISDSKQMCICYRPNYEKLLYRRRNYRRSQLPSIPKHELPLFWAELHDLGNPVIDNYQKQVDSTDHRNQPRQDSPDEQNKLKQSIEGLLGFPIETGLWESAILPTRIAQYQNHQLDQLLLGSELTFYGTPQKKVYFTLASEEHLFRDSGKSDASAGPLDISAETENSNTHLHPGAGAWLDETSLRGQIMNQLSNQGNHKPPLVSGRQDPIWQFFWQGRLSAQNWQPIRQGLRRKFKLPYAIPHPAINQPIATMRRNWNSRSMPQHLWRWQARLAQSQTDSLSQQESRRQKIMILLDRYGILFRALLQNELDSIQWRDIIIELRRLELAGEIHGGWFIEGLSGLQFASNQALQVLTRGLTPNRIWYLHAKDPLSLCGGVGRELGMQLPPRSESNWLVYHGSDPVLQIRAGGKQLYFSCKPDNRYIGAYLKVFYLLLKWHHTRNKRSVKVEQINDQKIYHSPYTKSLVDFGFRHNGNYLKLWPRVST